MLKSFTFSLVAVLLVLSILAPSIELLCSTSNDTEFVMDLNEEENNNQETEKKFDQKELYFTGSNELKSLLVLKKLIKSQTYLVFHLDLSAEILLPPPRSLA